MCSLYLPMKRHPVCITFTPTAYATNDTTIIHHVYKPDFSICVPFSTTGSWDLFAIKSAAVFGLVFFQVNGSIASLVSPFFSLMSRDLVKTFNWCVFCRREIFWQESHDAIIFSVRQLIVAAQMTEAKKSIYIRHRCSEINSNRHNKIFPQKHGFSVTRVLILFHDLWSWIRNNTRKRVISFNCVMFIKKKTNPKSHINNHELNLIYHGYRKLLQITGG